MSYIQHCLKTLNYEPISKVLLKSLPLHIPACMAIIMCYFSCVEAAVLICSYFWWDPMHVLVYRRRRAIVLVLPVFAVSATQGQWPIIN
jgi:hypothetical protein